MAGEVRTDLLGYKVFIPESLEAVVARKKLALVAFERGDGPWIRAEGNEREVSVLSLNAGEKLGMEIEGAVGCRHLHVGLNPLKLVEGQMYRFTKEVPDGERASKTCVEILTHG